MINIGFDDQKPIEDNEEYEAKHGDKIEKLREKRKTIKIPERRIPELMAGCDCVVVNEFGDDYHLSEEERIAKNKFYKAFQVFNKGKRKYRKLDEYVKIMREALKCLDVVAENNGMYDPDKFKRLFMKDKIYIEGLKFPKFIGKERKTIGWEFLSEFILSDEDPSQLVRKRNDDISSVEELKENETLLFDEGEVERIIAPETEEESIRTSLFYDADDDVIKDNDNIVPEMSTKESKKLIKEVPEFINTIKEIKRDNRSINNLSSFVYNMQMDDIESIARYDQEQGIASSADIPEFKGDLTKDKDYRRYLRELEEFEQTQFKEDYHGRWKTPEQIAELELKAHLEASGWNIRNLYDNKEREEKLKKIQKEEKAKEKAIKKKLTRIQNRRKRRMGIDVDDEETSKKKKKQGKKEYKKEKKKDQKEKDRINKEVEEDINEFLLNMVDNNTSDDFDEYKEQTLDWSWDNIKN